MNHHLPKVQHGLPTQQPNPTQPTRLPIFPIYAQAAKTAEKSENSDGGLVQNHTNFFYFKFDQGLRGKSMSLMPSKVPKTQKFP